MTSNVALASVPRPQDTPSSLAVVARLFLQDCPALTGRDLLGHSREPVIRQLARAVTRARAALR
jgi:hypothetical protein